MAFVIQRFTGKPKRTQTGEEKKKIHPLKIISLRSKTQWAEPSLLDQQPWKERPRPLRTLKDLRRSCYSQLNQVPFEVTPVLAGDVSERA